MDPCLNPSLLRNHGQFLSHDKGPDPRKTLVPRFSFCSTVVHHDIRPAVLYGWVEDLPKSDNPPWEERLDERLLWRGTNTGIFHGPGTRWRQGHRDHLIRYVNDLAGTADVLRSPPNGSEPVGEPVPLRKAYLNPALMDIQFGGTPNSCSPEVCDEVDRIYDWRKMQTLQEAGRYKYVFDVGSEFDDDIRLLTTFRSTDMGGRGGLGASLRQTRLYLKIRYIPSGECSVSFEFMHNRQTMFVGLWIELHLGCTMCLYRLICLICTIRLLSSEADFKEKARMKNWRRK